MISYQQISRTHPLYPGTRRLREMVLLKPIGYDMQRFEREYPGVEDSFVQFVAAVGTPADERAVGCALLLPESDEKGAGKLMQMAVDPQRRGEGIGKRLVIEVEKHAFAKLGLASLYCHAQVPAVPFYEGLGWVIEGDIFEEAGIPHKKMRFARPEVDTEPEPIPGW